MPSVGVEIRQVAVALFCVALLAALPSSAHAQQPWAGITEVTVGNPVVSDEPALRPTIGDEGQPLSAEDSDIIGKALALDPNSFANAPSGYDPRNPLQIRRNDSSSGAAWASVNFPEIATVDARVDPRNDQGRLGTTFKRSLPISRDFAVSLQSGYSVTETMGAPQAAASDIPLRMAPVGETAQPTPRVWGNENIAKLDILTTGTTFGAGLSSTSTDPEMHNTLSAEQKIYGPLGISTAVTDIGRANESKSVNARFKLTW